MTAPPTSPYATDGSLRFGVSFLVDHFRAFHAELVRLRGDADLTPTWTQNGQGTSAILDENMESAVADPAMTVCQRLAQRLEHDTIEAQRLGGALGIRLYREAGFVMAALADEILLHGPAWIGQPRWKTTLLESRMFKSYDGGERFFQKLDALLDARDPIETQLAVVYLLALKLGFEGKYRGEPETAAVLNRYRVRLFEFVANRAPDTGPGAPPITPGAYTHILSIDKRPFLPFIWGWAAALAAFLVLFLLVSHLTWLSLIGPVLAIVQGNP